MKIIDLLNKIANGEEVRFKIDGEPYHCYKYANLYDEVEKEEARWYISEDWLNEEVKIIEEDKKIEKLDKQIDITKFANEYKEVAQCLTNFSNKINEIIDHINKGDK